MSIRKTIPIVFNGGAYGTYLEWCLTTLTTDIEIISPLRPDGSSHTFRSPNLSGLSGWLQYVENGVPSAFVRLHPKTKEAPKSLTANLKVILSTVDKMIHLYPDRNSVLLNINNYFQKVSTEWWPGPGFKKEREAQRQQEYHEISTAIYQNWPVTADTPFNDIPNWIKREFLSIYFMPFWQDQVEWFHPNQWQDPRCRVVFINDLLNDFENTLQSLTEFLELDLKKDILQLIPNHENMLKVQKNLGQDLLCNQIIDSTVNNVYFDWQEQYLPLPSESWIQWRLRELGFEIRCHSLDIFPTNSVQLKKLLYTV